ncbi:hypothetical protein [Lewinella sp. W8]|uniref:hypothetical protein n=1 Tax=Lewinella sp. W8 TaxID=2528208 RepID=UPI001068AFD4|nr:hypothetical protein [Lewinella sp. W8]MTB53583.1 hypothetical protein [Lewinella sp. W8]
MMKSVTYGVLALILLSGLLGCGGGGQDNEYRIVLNDSIFNTGVNRANVYWRPGDSLAWEEALTRADSIHVEGNRWSVHFPEGAYEVYKTEDGFRSQQRILGWDRAFDTISRSTNALRLLDNNRVLIDLPAADVVLNGDSLRIGLLHIKDRAFSWEDFPVEYPDYLLLSTYGNPTVPLVMDQDNLGPISRKTVFRVGRKHYVLKSVDESRRELVIEPIASPRDVPVTAELDVYYKQVPVLGLDGEPTTVKRAKGKGLALYFWGFGPTGGKDILRLDSLYRQLPAEEQDKLDVALINHNNTIASLREFVEENDIRLPVYRSVAKTCLRMNCHPYLPYWVGVTNRGRITSYYTWPQWLEERLSSRGLADNRGGE